MALILITTYNRLNLLKQTISSIEKTAEGYTLLVVNDGSTDGTEKWLNGKGYNSIHFNKNMGLRHALNEGLKEAYKFNPDYISYCQDDVVFEKDWLRKCIQYWDAYSNGKKKIGFITCHNAPEHWPLFSVRSKDGEFMFYLKKTCRATHLFSSTERWKRFGEIPVLTPGVAAPKAGRGSLVDWWLVGHPNRIYPESEHSLRRDNEYVLVFDKMLRHKGVDESTWNNIKNPEYEWDE